MKINALGATITIALVVSAWYVWQSWPRASSERPEHRGTTQTSAKGRGGSLATLGGIDALAPVDRQQDYPGAIAGLADRAEAERHLPFLAEPRYRESRLVRYRHDTLQHLRPTDRFDLYLPNLDMTVTARLDAREDDDGWTRWRGELLSPDIVRHHEWLITEAPVDRYAVAYFDTPDGAVHLEAKNGYGWMRNAGDSKLDHDALVPPGSTTPDSSTPHDSTPIPGRHPGPSHQPQETSRR